MVVSWVFSCVLSAAVSNEIVHSDDPPDLSVSIFTAGAFSVKDDDNSAGDSSSSACVKDDTDDLECALSSS